LAQVFFSKRIESFDAREVSQKIAKPGLAIFNCLAIFDWTRAGDTAICANLPF
jgi:hypothetical protein